jgi:hypothetical protein
MYINVDRAGKADADMMTRIWVEDIDILTLVAIFTNKFVRFANGNIA